MTNSDIYSVKFGGLAGQGIKAAGQMLSKIATRSGYHIHTYTEFPSLIRGGHNIMQILISPNEVSAPLRQTDLLVAFNQDTLNRHSGELLPGSGIIFDADKKIDTSALNSQVILFPVPLSRLALESGNLELLSNTVAIGAVAALLGADLSLLLDLLSTEFSTKGQEMINMNHKAAQSGFEFASQNFTPHITQVLKKQENISPKMIVSGVEAVALGAIAGGLQFSAIYPMSPISGILQVLSGEQLKYGFVYKQPEDEISALIMSIGAGFAGARSLTATSGGGFCLMTEGLGLAAMTETPIVIIEGMRPGPATGLPTWSSQADLQFVLHAHQGEFPRIVLAAGDASEAFYMTAQALNLAEKYQTPVILLIDKNICDDDYSYPVFDTSGIRIDRGKLFTGPRENYARYALSPDGISDRSIPGSGNFFIANSDEHLISGISTEEISEIESQMTKRMSKLDTCIKEDLPTPQLIGTADAEITIVSWGSNKGAILHALRSLPNTNFLHLTWLNPFPIAAVTEILGKSKRIIDIECNFTGQLAALIREQTGINITDKLLKFDGRPIYPDEIISKINSLSNVK